MAKTKFEYFCDYLKNNDLEEVKNYLENDFLERIIHKNLKWRPIHLACSQGYLEIVKLLIDRNCDIESENVNRWRPIHYACSKGHIDIVALLIKKNCKIESQNNNDWRPIHFSCSNGHFEIVKLLINNRSNIESEEKDKWRPIHYACSKGHTEIVELLIKNKSDIESENIDNMRPIHLACCNGHIAVAKLLIDRGCKIDSLNNEKWAPIHFACSKGHIDIVELLIKYKCQIDIENQNKSKPIHLACFEGHDDITKLLIEQRCSIETENIKKMRPIHFACFNGHVNTVKLLIKEKCNIECENFLKMKPIHYACYIGHVGITKLLLKQNCNLESEDILKWRPIHFACHGGHVDIVKLLIEKKIDILAKIDKGNTPLELAKSWNHPDVVKLIEEALLSKKILDSILKNDVKTFSQLYSLETLVKKNHSEQSLLEIVFDNNADKIIKFILDKPIGDSEIRFIKDIVENNPVQLKNAELWQEIFLYKSIRDNNQEGFQLICSPDIINREHRIIPSSFLEEAAKRGRFFFVQEILKKSKFDSEMWDNAKRIALENDHHQILNAILSREFLLRCRKKANLSILHTSVCDNDPDMVEYIMKKKLVDPNNNNEILGTAFSLAVILCHEKCAAVLEKLDVLFDTQNQYWQTPLHYAISNGMIEHCPYVTDRTQDIEKPGFMGQTALHCAVMRGCEELCENLVKMGASSIQSMKFLQHSSQEKDQLPFTENENALTLCVKIHKKIYPCFNQALIETKGNSSDSEGNSLLHLSARLFDLQLCNALIQVGGDVDSVNKELRTPLLELLSNLNKETFVENEAKIINIVQLFVTESNVNKFVQDFENIFHVASQLNCERLVLSLLSQQQNQLLEISENLIKVSLEKKFFEFCQAILGLVPKRHLERYISTEIINVALSSDRTDLLESFVMLTNDSVRQSTIEKVLYRLAKLDATKSFECLLNFELKDPGCFQNGETLLTGLLKEINFKYSLKIIQSYTNAKAQINLRNERKQTPLQVAIEIEAMEMVPCLTFITDNVDNEDIDGNTALIQLFKKISESHDKDQKFSFYNLIKTIISAGGNIYYETSKNVKNIEFCQPVEMRKEIECFAEKLQQKMVNENPLEKIVVVLETKICQICKHKEVDCVFECGHTICEVCGSKTVRCPFCNFEPVEPKRIYF